MHYLECTINKSHDFKNSDNIHDTLKVLGYQSILISHEKTETADTHFHVLGYAINQEIDIIQFISNMFESTNIIFRVVQSFQKTVSYFIKDGKYKLYDNFVLPERKSKRIDLEQLVNDIKNGFTYTDLVIKYGMQILKNAYGINILINNIKGKE